MASKIFTYVHNSAKCTDKTFNIIDDKYKSIL